MKKILALSVIMVLLAAAASAQVSSRTGTRNHQREFNNRQLTRPERFELRKDALRKDRLERRSRRDGRVTRMERKRLHKARHHHRAKAYRFRHNGRHRSI